MGSLVPPPSSDRFTSELCIFLSALASTSGTQFSTLTNQLVKLREVLLDEVVRESSDSENDAETSSDETDQTFEGSHSDSSTEKESDEESEVLVKETVDERKTIEKVKGESQKISNKDARTSNNHRVMVSLQKGARYELEDKQVKQVFSQYGKVIKMVLYQKPISGAWGFIDFRTSQSATAALNQVVRAGKCWLHTSLPLHCLTEEPVPHQILLESRYLPHVWEKEIILRSFFTKYGVVTGVTLLGLRKFGVQRFIISFKEQAVAQDLIGTTVKILTCTVVVKEVSSSTIGAANTTEDDFERGVGTGGGGDTSINA